MPISESTYAANESMFEANASAVQWSVGLITVHIDKTIIQGKLSLQPICICNFFPLNGIKVHNHIPVSLCYW